MTPPLGSVPDHRRPHPHNRPPPRGAATDAPMPLDGPASLRWGARRAVLVVDDDPGSRTYLAEALEGLGCRAIQAADGGEALRRLMEDPPDLIFTDLMMPGMDGLEFLTLARTQIPGLPLVLVTACDQTDAAAEAMRCGADAFLRKPVSLADLAAALGRFLPAPVEGSRSCHFPAGPPGGRGPDRQAGGSAARLGDEGAPERGMGGLDPALLHKATQLSLLTMFGAGLRDAADPVPPGSSPELAVRRGTPGSGFLVRRSLDVVLRALPGDRAVLALTEAGGVQEIASRGGGDGTLPVQAVQARMEEAGSGHAWHGVLDGSPLVAAPLLIQGTRVGIICVGRGRGARAFTWADRELLAAFSAQTAVTLENASLGRQLEQAFQETVTSLIVALEARDKYTEGHSLRVADYASGVAVVRQLPPAVYQQIRTASLLHDLGKVGVRDAILEKPGRLSPEEWAAMREHPVLGWKILGPLGFLSLEAEGVRHHHEHFDGGGYPDGLAGEGIPLPARIIAVADAFDAMTTPRPYRSPRSAPDALAELQRTAGSQFDPAIVESFRAWLVAGSGAAGVA